LKANGVKQASRELLQSIKSQLSELDHFWEKEQTKADVEVFILDKVFSSLPTPLFTAEEKEIVAASVYAYVWQQAVNGSYAGIACHGSSIDSREGTIKKSQDFQIDNFWFFNWN